MKLAVALIFVLLLVGVSGIAAAQDPGSSTAPVSISITTAAVRDGFETRTDVLLLWNRDIRPSPIGHGVKSCLKVGSGGILGGGIMSCSLTLNLPRGKVAASGVVHNLNHYTLVITGGTRAYEDAHGPLFVRREDGVRRMSFTVG